MASTYLLPCSCGAQHPVEPRQAGDHIRCDCGAELEVPTLRKLRELPEADTAEDPAQRGVVAPRRNDATAHNGSWKLGHALLMAGLLLAASLAAVSTVMWMREPERFTYDPVERTEAIDESLEAMSPADAFAMWPYYRELIGRGQLEPVVINQESASLTRRKQVRLALQIAAGVFAVIGVVGFLMIGKRGDG